jgi:hypothetical protein
MAEKAAGQRDGVNPGPSLAAHYPSNPGVLIGHMQMDPGAVSGREGGVKNATTDSSSADHPALKAACGKGNTI